MTTRVAKSGFTLLEILLAIFILGIVLTTVYAAYTGTMRTVTQTDYDNHVYSMARSTMKRMVEDIGSVCTFGGKFIFLSQSSELGVSDLAELTFLTNSHISFGEDTTGGLAAIMYYLEEDAKGNGYILLRKDVVYTGEESIPLEKSGGYILCKRIKSIRYTFYDTKGDDFDNWDSATDDHKDRAPLMVAVHMTFLDPEDEDNTYPFMTKMFIPMVTAE